MWLEHYNANIAVCELINVNIIKTKDLPLKT